MSKSADFANVFSEIMKKAAETSTAEKERIKEEIHDLEQQLQELETKIADLHRQSEAIDGDVAVALQHAAREAGIKITIGAVQSQIRRATSKITDEIITTVANAVPQGRENGITSVEIGKQAQIEGTVVSKALVRLLKANQIKSVGQRRAKRYFR